MSKLMITTPQFKAIFGLGNGLGFGEEDIRDLVEEAFGFRSLKRLSFDQANHIIEKFGGRPFSRSFNSKRTEQYHRQKNGVEQIVTQEHLNKLHTVWFAKPGRTEEGLKTLCRRMLHDKEGNPLDKPRTTKECGKVIEAVKSMNRRERTFNAFSNDKEAA